jgi:hypothetical protein
LISRALTSSILLPAVAGSSTPLTPVLSADNAVPAEAGARPQLETYSSPFCMSAKTAGTYEDKYVSNCGLAPASAGTALSADNTGVKGVLDPATAGNNIELVNALEINWALPYAIPNDRT